MVVSMNPSPEEILNFWFTEIGPNRWFSLDLETDAMILEKYLKIHESAANDELKDWKDTPEGMLALLLLLDIFPRHMFRGTARAYQTDDAALELARVSIINHFDDRIDRTFKLFFYLPFSHSENMDNQRLATFYVRERTKEPSWVEFVNGRRQIVERFGRFPQRNHLLARDMTPEEDAFLRQKMKP